MSDSISEITQVSSTACTDISSNSACRLFDLPAELRNAIYEFAIVIEGESRIDDKRGSAEITVHDQLEQTTQQHWKQPAISLTCRRARREALPIFYGQHVFNIGPQSRWNYSDVWSLRFAGKDDWITRIASHLHLVNCLTIEVLGCIGNPEKMASCCYCTATLKIRRDSGDDTKRHYTITTFSEYGESHPGDYRVPVAEAQRVFNLQLARSPNGVLTPEAVAAAAQTFQEEADKE